MDKETKSGYTNRLIRETSPYLLQHAHNPVDWYPWGEEALDRSRKEDKPILLSIGYSACHWCHVMEEESFEDETVARLMNERFVCIKVDREERPDLDELYMNAVQVMTGSGGWPLNVFLTPDQVPFHGGTYFPPEDRGGMPGFPKVLTAVSDYYRSHRDQVAQMVSQLRETLRRVVEIAPSGNPPEEDVLLRAFDTMEKQFDPADGGFGGAPKFPNSMGLSFLLRYWNGTGTNRALEMVELTLEKMAKGGIYDQLGGGFHRYSVDGRWLVPHFEKMLYDNALLSRTYFEAFQATGKENYRRIGEETLAYVVREMRSPEGGFYSSQDADTEGEEGKFYVWTRDEVKALLGEDRATPFCAYYGVSSRGNFEGASSVFAVSAALEKVSELYRIPRRDLEKMLEQGRRTLFEEREHRPRPARDEKVLTSWNGLMISGYVKGFEATGNAQHLVVAKEAASFLLQKMKSNGRLMRVFKDGRSHTNGLAEDYAFLIQALIDLYEGTFEREWLQEAALLNQEMIGHFWDEKNGGFFYSGSGNEPLIARSKNPYDNVLPSPNSVAAFNLIRLAYLTGDLSLKEKAGEIFRLVFGLVSEHPSGFSHLLSAFSFSMDPDEIGVVGRREDPQTQRLLREIHRTYLPKAMINLKDPEEAYDTNWFPFLADKGVPEVATAFVCRRSTCLPPAATEGELRKILS
jgi:uncharacterized protein